MSPLPTTNTENSGARYLNNAVAPRLALRRGKNLAADQNSLDAGLLDLLLRGLGKLVRMDGHRSREFASREHLDQLVTLLQQTERNQLLDCQLRLAKFGDAVQVHDGVFGPENIGEAALR